MESCVFVSTVWGNDLLPVWRLTHHDDVTMSGMASQITSLTIVYSTVYTGADQRKHQSPASLAFVRGIHRGPVNSPHKWPVTRKLFPFDDVIMHCPNQYFFIVKLTIENKCQWNLKSNIFFLPRKSYTKWRLCCHVPWKLLKIATKPKHFAFSVWRVLSLLM